MGSYRFIADNWNVFALDSWDPYKPDKKEFRVLTHAQPPASRATALSFQGIPSKGGQQAYVAIGSDHQAYFLAVDANQWKPLALPEKLRSVLQNGNAELTGVVVSRFAYVFLDSRGTVYRCAPTQLQPELGVSGKIPDFVSVDALSAPEGNFSSFSIADHPDGLFYFAASSSPLTTSGLFRLVSSKSADGAPVNHWKKLLIYRDSNPVAFNGLSIYPLDERSKSQAQSAGLASPSESRLYGVLGYVKNWADPYQGNPSIGGIFLFTNAGQGSFQPTGPTADLGC